MTKTDDLARRRSPRRKTQVPDRREPRWDEPAEPLDDEEDEDDDERPRPVLTATQTDYADRLHERRRALVRRMILRLSVFVLLPTLLVAMYHAFIASPRYVSEARVTVHAKDEAATSMFSAFLGVAGSSGSKEIYVLQNYVTSPEALGTLDQWLNIRGHYSGDGVDWWSRLDEDASKEKLADYYAARVEAEIEPDGQILIIRTEAFDPEFSASLSQSLLTLSEELLNKMAERAREDAVSFARRELATAEDRLRGIRLKLLEFRNQHGELNPQSTAATITGIVSTMEQQLASARAELAQVQSFMQSDSPKVIALRTRIGTLERQIAAERSRLAAPEEKRPAAQPALPSAAKDGQVYAEILNAYEALLIEEEFARLAFEAAFTGLEVARADAARKHSYIVDFVSPHVPEEAIRPDGLTETLTAFAMLLIGYLVVGFLISAIREHARV